jgi:hypothetical protein
VIITAAPQKEVRPMKVFAIQVFDVEKVIAALYPCETCPPQVAVTPKGD